jgi:hypothetical protein
VPLLGVAPSTRTLGIATIGIAAVVGVVIERAWFRIADDEGNDAIFLRGAAAILVFARLFHGPAFALDAMIAMRDSAIEFEQGAHALGERVDASPKREVNVLRGEWQTMLWAPFALNERHEPPARWRVLTLAKHALVLRKDDSTIEVVAPRDLGIFPVGEDDLFRSESNPLVIGEETSSGGVTATLYDLPKSVGVRAVFDQPLDDSDVWVAQKGRAFVEAPPPKVGFGFPLDR